MQLGINTLNIYFAERWTTAAQGLPNVNHQAFLFYGSSCGTIQWMGCGRLGTERPGRFGHRVTRALTNILDTVIIILIAFKFLRHHDTLRSSLLTRRVLRFLYCVGILGIFVQLARLFHQLIFRLNSIDSSRLTLLEQSSFNLVYADYLINHFEHFTVARDSDLNHSISQLPHLLVIFRPLFSSPFFDTSH